MKQKLRHACRDDAMARRGFISHEDTKTQGQRTDDGEQKTKGK